MFKKKKNKKTILLLLLLILGISVGYAALSSTLNISGSSQIGNVTWDIHWNNVVIKNGSITGDQVTSPATIIGANSTEIEYSITFDKPGEFYEFNVDAVNAGSIDAMIETISKKVFEADGATETTLPDYLEYTVTYGDNKALAVKHLLPAHETETYKVRIQYKKDITTSQLPTTDKTLVFRFGVNYVQADDTAVERFQASYVYSLGETRVGSAIPDGIDTYETVSEAQAGFGRDFFYRHTVKNNSILENKLGFIVGGNDYYISGGTDNYDSNKTVLEGAFGSSNCTEDSDMFVCNNGSLEAGTDRQGSAWANDMSSWEIGIDRNNITSGLYNY